jgi:hypothetical protein
VVLEERVILPTTNAPVYEEDGEEDFELAADIAAGFHF